MLNMNDTERVIRESIICLCRNHFGVRNGEEAAFEVDGIICINFVNKKSDKYAVVKIHELITGGNIELEVSDGENVNDAEGKDGCVVSAVMPLDDAAAQKSVHVSDDVSNGSHAVVDACDVTSQNDIGTGSVNKRKRKSTAPHHNSYYDHIQPYSFKINDHISLTSEDRASLKASELTNLPVDDKLFENGSSPTLVHVKDEPVWLIDGNSLDGSNSSQHQISTMKENLPDKDHESVSSVDRIDEELMYSCSLCDVVSKTCAEIQQHVESSHNVITEEQMMCNTCRIVFGSESSYTSHCKLSSCKGNVDVSAYNLASILLQDIEMSGESFSKESSVSGEDECVTFRSSKPKDDCIDLELLPDSVESSMSASLESMRTCSVCDREFSNFPSFNVHLTEAHSLYPCPYCEMTYANETEREHHLYDHTGESPLECSICGLCFSNASALFKHKKLHVQPSTKSRVSSWSGGRRSDVEGSRDLGGMGRTWSDQPVEGVDDGVEMGDTQPDPFRVFHCDACEEVVEGIEMFTDHCNVIHQRVPCPYCGATFSHKASMYRHQRVHTGVKPFRCNLCPLAFIRKEPLRAHMIRDHRMNNFFL